LNLESRLARTIDALVFCALLVLTFLLACFPNQDMDIWWHLKAGRSLLRGNGIPTHDTYSIAAAGHEWIDLHWLFQAAAAYVHSRGGMDALIVAAGLIAVVAIAVGVLAGSTRATAPFVAIVWLPALLVMSSRFLVRPEMISLACLAAYLWVLRRADARPKRLWLLVPVQVLWVNVQGLFCFGPFLLICWLVDRWVHAQPEQRTRLPNATLVPSLAVAAACFANPYGWRGAVYPLALARTMFIDGAFYRNHIGELASPLAIWQATAYRDVYVWAALVLFAMTAFSFLASEDCIRVFRVGVFAVFSGLALTAIRNLPQFALVSGFLLAWNLSERVSQSERARSCAFAVRAASLATVLLLACALATGSLYRWIGSSRVFALGEQPHWHAHDAARFAAREGMPDAMLVYHEGQAALVEFHMREGQRVYADARLEVMRRASMERYYQLADDIAKGDENWPRILPSPTAILVDHSSHFPLETALLSDPAWNCAWFGPVAAVYVPATDETAPRDPSGNLVQRHFGVPKRAPIDSGAVAQELRNGLNRELMEASALVNIARAAGDRATQAGADRRLLLLLAARLAQGEIERLPAAACQIGAAAAFQMYAVPITSPEEWQLLEMLGPARSRYLLQRCQEFGPGEFAPLADEYNIVCGLGDADAVYLASRKISGSAARTAQHVRLRSLVKQGLGVAHFRASAGPGGFIDPEDEIDRQVLDLFTSRRFLRIKARFAADASNLHATLPESGASRDIVARACLVCGDPQSARKIWQQSSDREDQSRCHAGIGISYLAEQDHARARENFDLAIHRDPANVEAHCALAVCHLELGNASQALDACNLALDVPEISEGMQQFCERMRDFAGRYCTNRD